MTGIVILNYQTWKYSERCMKSIFTTYHRPFRIYFVDNASEHPMPESMQEFLNKNRDVIYFFRTEKNRGYAAGNNIGIKAALRDDCDILIISNNDIVFQKNAINHMAECLVKHPEAGIVGPKVLNETGDIQPSRCSKKTGLLEIFQIYTCAKIFCRKQWREYFCLDQNPERQAYVYHVSGCCFAVSKSCAKEVFPLDEGTILYHEELILGIIMEQKGFRTIYEPDSVVVHKHGGTTMQVQPFMYQCRSQSELYYCGKYLNAKKWQLWMLYQYRKIVYLFRCIKSAELRNYRKTYIGAVKKSWKKQMETRGE